VKVGDLIEKLKCYPNTSLVLSSDKYGTVLGIYDPAKEYPETPLLGQIIIEEA